jgi:predicted amidohydrolase YtcJ
MLQEMQKRGLLTIRINALLRPRSAPTASIRARGVGIKQNEGDECCASAASSSPSTAVRGRLDARSLREAVGRERHVSRPADDRHRALHRRRPRAESQDWRVATHAVGDAAIDLVLNAYEKANAERSITARRWSIEHAFIGARIICRE